MKIVFVHPSGIQYTDVNWRYQAFLIALKQRYHSEVLMMDENKFSEKISESSMECRNADVIILDIRVGIHSAQMMQHWRARDKTIVIDLSTPVVYNVSDHTYQIGPSIFPSDTGQPIPPITIDKEKLIWTLKIADGVITNSRVMMEEWSGMIDIFYLPDFLDLDKFLIHPYESHSGIHIGIKIYEENNNKKLAEVGLLSALEVIGSQYEQVKVILFGEHPHFAHLLKLPSKQKLFLPPLELMQWQFILPSLDIGVLPKSSAFDQRCGREDVLELMAMQIPWVASDGMWCHELRQYGWLVQNKPGAWERVLEDMVDDLDTYRHESSEAYLYSLGQGIDENVEKLASICTSIRSHILDGVV
jgi:hypothetical protein